MASYLKKIKLRHSEKQNKPSAAGRKGCARHASRRLLLRRAGSCQQRHEHRAAPLPWRGCTAAGSPRRHLPPSTQPRSSHSPWLRPARRAASTPAPPPTPPPGETLPVHLLMHNSQRGGSSQRILPAEISRQLPRKVMCDPRKVGKGCMRGAVQREKARHAGLAGQPREHGATARAVALLYTYAAVRR